MAREDKGVVDSYKEHGIEYVSTTEFARREYVAYRRIMDYIKQGILSTSHKIGRKTYMNWKTENQKLQRYIKQSVYSDRSLKPKKPIEITSEIEETATREIKEQKATETETIIDTKRLLKNFDPTDFKDCYETSDDEEGKSHIDRDEDGNPMLNWVKVDKKITALIRNLELKRKEGELIKIDEVVRFLSIAFAKTQGKLSNIPDRYTSRFAAFYQKETGNEVSNETTTALKNMLTAETKNILADLSKEIENSEYGEN